MRVEESRAARRRDKSMEKAPLRLVLNLGSVTRIAMAIGFGALGVVIAHHPMIVSGFRRIQTDLADTRLIHYLLEHGYLWAQRDPEHLDFWSPPFFYPLKNVAAYSDLLLSVGPVYWLWRVLGASPDLSFGLWMISMSALNYAAGLLLFRNGFGFGTPAAVAGASLVAFGAPRLNQLNHQQLLPFFFPLLALYALARLVGDMSLGWRIRTFYWLLAMAALVAQLYAGVYLGWFTIIGLGLTAAVGLAMRPCRDVLLKVVWRDAWAITAAGLGGIALLQPFLSHYLPAAREVGSQYYPMLRALHPGVGSWLDVGPRNWFWGHVIHTGSRHDLELLNNEQFLGIGFLTSIACVVGLVLGRKWPLCPLAAVATLIIWLATTYLPGTTMAIVAACVACYCVAGLFYEVDRPGLRAMALAAQLCPVLLMPFPNPCVIVLGLTTIILCLLEMGRVREDPRHLIAPAAALAVISVKLLALEVILHGALLIAPIAGLLAYYWRPRPLDLGLGALACLMLFLILLTFADRPGLILGGLAAAPISLALTASRQYRPPTWLLSRAMLIALPFLTLYYGRDSLWLIYSGMIPGAVAIRALGRVVLILLVPAALGLACLVQYLDQRRLAVVSWIVALVCLAEQTVTTDAFDAAANRASIGSLASQIDQGWVAFYYHPVKDLSYPRAQLDAMWASLDTRVPTVNGYTGHAPKSWHVFFTIDDESGVNVEDVLAVWEKSQGLLPNHVQWIGADDSGPTKVEMRQGPDGNLSTREPGSK
jgi:hypothetical protein